MCSKSVNSLSNVHKINLLKEKTDLNFKLMHFRVNSYTSLSYKIFNRFGYTRQRYLLEKRNLWVDFCQCAKASTTVCACQANLTVLAGQTVYSLTHMLWHVISLSAFTDLTEWWMVFTTQFNKSHGPIGKHGQVCLAHRVVLAFTHLFLYY